MRLPPLQGNNSYNYVIFSTVRENICGKIFKPGKTKLVSTFRLLFSSFFLLKKLKPITLSSKAHVYFAHSGILYILYTRRGCKFKVQAKRRDSVARNKTKIKNNKITVKVPCWWKSSLKTCRVYNKFSVR